MPAFISKNVQVYAGGGKDWTTHTVKMYRGSRSNVGSECGYIKRTVRTDGTFFDTVAWNTDRDMDSVDHPSRGGGWENPYGVPKYVRKLYARAAVGLDRLHF